MSQKKYIAKEHVGSDWNALSKGSKNGLCLSGGGSRALSAGLGQLIGLKSVNNNNGGSLLDSIDCISSVSGGTWLTSIYSFSENQDLDDLLGVYTPPNTLTEDNIGDLSSGSIGHAPSQLSYSGILDIVHEKIGLKNIYKYPEVRKWIWPVIVGELVLKPYNLYQGDMQGSGASLVPMPKRFFSLSQTYMEQNIKSLGGSGTSNKTLSEDDFYYHQDGRPLPIMNTNIKLDYQQSDSPLLPVQGTPIAVGATGTIKEKCESLTANGGVDSFAFTSDLQSQASDEATVNIDRRYSLIDIVSCSSAFFAQIIGEKINSAAAIYSMAQGENNGTIDSSFKDTEEGIQKDLASLIPQYNFWPVGESNPINQNTGFADGGNLDNTGILGMLARSYTTKIVVCYNAEIPLGDIEDIRVDGYTKSVAMISADIPILFGYQPKPVNGQYVKFSSNSPSDLNYLKAAQVFDSSEFGPLVTALFSACNGEKSPTVARTKKLSVCDNAFAGICNRGDVDVLWIYNNYASDWVDEIKKNSRELADNIKYGRYVPLSDFHNFPNYSTGLQVDLNATQVNALAQFQAWILNQVSTQILDMFGE
jgi:hypothetical protein